MKYLFLIFLLSCGNENDEQESINKLRTLGIETTPLVTSPSSASSPRSLTLTVYVAVPFNETVTVSKFTDQKTSHAILLTESDYNIVAGSESYTTLNGFQLFTFKATVNVPQAEAFKSRGGSGQIRYGFNLKSASNSENIVGNALIVAENSPQLQWTKPKIILTKPIDKSSVPHDTDIDIQADLKNPNDEDLKLGWFVSGGDIGNRRAQSTIWKSPSPGLHTIIGTVRGRKSHGFAIQIINVKTE